jgi:hypothetical protein
MGLGHLSKNDKVTIPDQKRQRLGLRSGNSTWGCMLAISVHGLRRQAMRFQSVKLLRGFRPTFTGFLSGR